MYNNASLAMRLLTGMLKRFVIVLTLGNVLIVCDPNLRAAAAMDTACEPGNGGIRLSEGFCAAIFADNLGNVRHIAVRDNGDVYAALRRQDRIVALRDSNGDGRADITKRFGQHGGSGIGIYKDYLYVGSPTVVRRYPLRPGELLPGPAQVVIEDFPSQGQHAAKTFALDGQGYIYVNIGAPSNACQRRTRTRGSPGLDPCPQLQRHAGIWRYDATRLKQRPDDGMRYASGIRNAVAIAWRQTNDALYLVQHGRDQLHQLWPDLFTAEQSAELPAEEFFAVARGAVFGWPYCYYDQIQQRKVLAPEYGGDGHKVGRCRQYQDPILAFPGHWAPNGLMFYSGAQFPPRYRGGAFIAFHGSWNRAPLPQRGYNVVFVPFKDGRPAADWEVFADGFAGAKVVDNPGQARFRPMGLAQGPGGALYIADTEQGRIWRVVYRGQ